MKLHELKKPTILTDDEKLPENFCPVPWMHMHLETDGSFKTCCRSFESLKDQNGQTYKINKTTIETVWKDGLQSLRDQFSKNERPKQCSVCWREEESGSVSMRKHWLSDHKSIFGWSLDPKIVPKAPTSLDLWLNNTCNLKCRICGPYNSAKWIKEAEDLLNQKLEDPAFHAAKKFTGENFEILKKWLPTVQKVNFFGGEPFLGKEQIEILKAIIDYGNPGYTEISYTTNGTVINQAAFDVWKHFKQIHLVFSVDGIGERFHYQRFPGEWSSVLNTIETVKKTEVNKLTMLVNTTISIYSVYYLDEIVEWFHFAGFKNWQLMINLLFSPEHMSIGILPLEVKEIIAERLKRINLDNSQLIGNSIQSLINFMMTQPSNPELFAKFVSHTKKTDAYRKNDFSKTFPEFYNILKPYILQNDSTEGLTSSYL